MSASSRGRKKVKRRYRLGIIVLLLTITSFLLFNSCGIPTYLLLNDNDVDLTSEAKVGTDGYNLTLQITDDAYAEFSDKNTTPSIKLFYAYSISNLPGALQVPESIIALSKVESSFDSLYKNNDNLNVFSFSSSKAPALYLYRKDVDSTTISSSKSIFTYDTDEAIDALVLGTFSSRSHNNDNNNDFIFEGAPEMDFQVELSHFVDSATSGLKEISFEIEYEYSGDYTIIRLITDDDQEIYLGDYQKERFFNSLTNLDNIIEQLNQHDSLTYEKIIEALETSSGNTKPYLHIWAALFGGDGDFNNIVWSDLLYVGEIPLSNL